MGPGLSGKWMTRISGAELPWHGEASFSGWQDEGWGSLVSSQDSKQKASEMRRAGWICQCLVPWGTQFRLTLTLHSQDKSLCHSSPSLPRHKFNLSSIIFTEELEYTQNHRWIWRETFFFCNCVMLEVRILTSKEVLLFFLKEEFCLSAPFTDAFQREVRGHRNYFPLADMRIHTCRIETTAGGVNSDVRALQSSRSAGAHKGSACVVVSITLSARHFKCPPMSSLTSAFIKRVWMLCLKPFWMEEGDRKREEKNETNSLTAATATRQRVERKFHTSSRLHAAT